MMERKVRSLLSLCQRAGKMNTGEITEGLIAKGEAYFVIIAGDASDNTKKKYINKCEYYNVPWLICSDKEELSGCIGRYERSVFAITDKGFAQKLMTELDYSK